MFEICLSRITWLHRLPAGFKLLVLAFTGAAVFLTNDPRILGGFIGFAALLPLSAWLPLAPIVKQITPAATLIAALATFHIVVGDPVSAFLVTARLGTVILLAVALTLTTRVSAMVDALEYCFTPLKYIGINPAKTGLTLSLAIRFIPVLFTMVTEIREAQKARGLEGSLFAVVMPLLVRTLRMADDLAEAISARGYDGN
ncbi:MAG: energy-coupling factor transporter transmembrane protein EcfT [Rhodospirillaceae bacterium]|nr:energy-coupling factor transporter transmembrane protein EcfT [Rhodospirillaceae bacterium]